MKRTLAGNFLAGSISLLYLFGLGHAFQTVCISGNDVRTSTFRRFPENSVGRIANSWVGPLAGTPAFMTHDDQQQRNQQRGNKSALEKTLRDKLREATGFSLTAFRAAWRTATGISLTAIYATALAASGLWIRKITSLVLSIFPDWVSDTLFSLFLFVVTLGFGLERLFSFFVYTKVSIFSSAISDRLLHTDFHHSRADWSNSKASQGASRSS